MIVLEGSKPLCFKQETKESLFEYFHLITTLSGKGTLLILTGILFMSAKPLITNLVVGAFDVVVGVACCFYSWKGQERLAKFQSNHPMTSSSEEEIRIKFM